MKSKLSLFSLAAILFLAAAAIGCAPKQACVAGIRTDALDGSAWNASTWISAADAQVATENEHDRAADGASWFVSTVKNDAKVVSAKWMTTGLGVYEIYVNGTLIGEEILKPGFTHFAKTKRSFTYDITGALKTKAGAELSLIHI